MHHLRQQPDVRQPTNVTVGVAVWMVKVICRLQHALLVHQCAFTLHAVLSMAVSIAPQSAAFSCIACEDLTCDVLRMAPTYTCLMMCW